jgi:hypothetical protein
MPDLNLNPELIVGAETHLAPLQAEVPDGGSSVIQSLAPLSHAVASWHHHFNQGKDQVIIRFHNGYGAIFSEHRLLEGVYEIAPLRFHGPGPHDYDFYFRSHIADLTWCSDHDEMLRVCEQIACLLPPAAI